MRRSLVLLAAACGLLLASPASAEALKIVTFAGASNWPLWAAQARGFFTQEGLEPTLSFTPNSVEMATGLAAGTYDIAMTSVDNVIAYDEGQGEVSLPANPDFIAFMGCDNGFLSLMAAPRFADIRALKGETVSVDAMTTGFAFVLREMLAKAGLGPDDVSFVKVGGGAGRLAALREGKQAATLLNSPLDLIAEQAGFKRLGMATAMIGPYQGIVGATRNDWAQHHAREIEGFIRAYRAAIDFLYDPDHRSDALTILTDNLPGTTPALADRIYAVLLAEHGGLYRDLGVDPAGMATVLALRRKYGVPGKPLPDAAKYIDDRYRNAAVEKVQ